MRYEPRCEKTGLRGFLTRSDTNQPVQKLKMAIALKLLIKKVEGLYYLCSNPDSLVVRASASRSEGRGFAPRPRHSKGVKNGTGSSLADARNKRVVLGRYKNAGRYLLLVVSQ